MPAGAKKLRVISTNGRGNGNGNGNGKGLQITWVSLIATLGFAAALTSGAWTFFQSQVGHLEQQMQTANLGIAGDIKDDRVTLDHLRSLSVLRDEHKEYTRRMDGDIASIEKRLDVIESTRPTAGELLGTAASIREQLIELKDRMRFLEQAPRPTRTQLPPTEQH